MATAPTIYYKFLCNGILYVIGERKVLVTYERTVLWTYERMMEKTKPDITRTPICLN